MPCASQFNASSIIIHKHLVVCFSSMASLPIVKCKQGALSLVVCISENKECPREKKTITEDGFKSCIHIVQRFGEFSQSSLDADHFVYDKCNQYHAQQTFLHNACFIRSNNGTGPYHCFYFNIINMHGMFSYLSMKH